MNVQYKRCGCGNIHLERETCAACIGRKRADVMAVAGPKQSPEYAQWLSERKAREVPITGFSVGDRVSVAYLLKSNVQTGEIVEIDGAYARVKNDDTNSRFQNMAAEMHELTKLPPVSVAGPSALDRIEGHMQVIRAAQDIANKGPTIDGVFAAVMRASEEPAAKADAAAFVAHVKEEIALATDAIGRAPRHTRGTVESVKRIAEHGPVMMPVEKLDWSPESYARTKEVFRARERLQVEAEVNRAEQERAEQERARAELEVGDRVVCSWRYMAGVPGRMTGAPDVYGVIKHFCGTLRAKPSAIAVTLEDGSVVVFPPENVTSDEHTRVWPTTRMGPSVIIPEPGQPRDKWLTVVDCEEGQLVKRTRGVRDAFYHGALQDHCPYNVTNPYRAERS